MCVTLIMVAEPSFSFDQYTMSSGTSCSRVRKSLELLMQRLESFENAGKRRA